MGISLDLGIPKLMHAWADARNRRKIRALRDDVRELKAERRALRVALRTCKKRRRDLERDLR